MLKVYLSHPISTTGEFNDSIRVAKRIEKLSKHVYVGDAKDIEVNGTVYEFEEGSTGVFVDTPKFEVYAPALNKEINDKNNDPTPEMIYEQDVDNLLNADVVVINYTSGRSHGTILELGMLAGMYEMWMNSMPSIPKVFVYSSNKRMLQPQFWHGIASEGGNHMVLGAIDKHFEWCGTEDGMLKALSEL